MQINTIFMKDYRKLQVFTFLRYFSDALIYAFLVLFFHSLNLSSLETGTLLASVPFMAVSGNLIVYLLTKKGNRNLLLLKILLPIEIIGVVFIAFFKSFFPVLLFSLLINFCSSATYSLLEGLASKTASEANKNYTGIRIFGSIAFFLSSLGGGFLIKGLDYRITFMISGAIKGLSFVTLFFIRNTDKEVGNIDNKKKELSLLKNRSFIYYLIFYVLVVGMSTVTDTFFALYAKSRGMGNEHYGIVYASMILAEIVVMFVLSKIKNVNKVLVLLLASTCLVLRTALLIIDLPDAFLSIVPIFRGIGWGMLLYVHVNTLRGIVGEKSVTKGILILTLFLQSFAGILNQFGPLIIANFLKEYRWYFLVLFVIGLVGLAIELWSAKKGLFAKNESLKSR